VGLTWYFLTDAPSSPTLSDRRDTPTTVSTRPSGSGNVIEYLAGAPGGAVSLSSFHGREVFNRLGEKLGSVTDLVVDADGRITAAVVSVGGFLGLGEKEVAVPFASLQRMQNQSLPHLVIDAGRGQLHAAPPFQMFREQTRSGAPDAKTPALTAPAVKKLADPAEELKQ
jgi:sporulation protein YlmC with PRC-barrel domain